MYPASSQNMKTRIVSLTFSNFNLIPKQRKWLHYNLYPMTPCAIWTLAQNVAWLSSWSRREHPWQRCPLDGSIHCSKACMCLSPLMVPSQMSKFPWSLTHPYCDRSWLLNFALVLFLEDVQKLSGEWAHQTKGHFSTLLQSISDGFWVEMSTAFLDVGHIRSTPLT